MSSHVTCFTWLFTQNGRRSGIRSLWSDNVKNGVKLGKNCTSQNNFRVGRKDWRRARHSLTNHGSTDIKLISVSVLQDNVAISLGNWFTTFRNSAVVHFQRWKCLRKRRSRNVGNHLHVDTVSYPRISQLWSYENLQAHTASLSAVFIGFHEAFYENDALRLGMRAHRLRLVLSHSHRRGIWLICNGRAWECVHTCRVQSSRPRFLPSQAFWAAIVRWETKWPEGPPGIVCTMPLIANTETYIASAWVKLAQEMG